MSIALTEPTVRTTWEQGIADYRLDFPRITPEEKRAVDWMRFPPIAPIYLEQIGAIEDLPPKADSFETAVFLRTNMARTPAIRWRLRANFYPSFVAQHHLTLVLLERFRHVTWSAKEDLTGIASAMGSDNSRRWQTVKERRNPQSPDVWLVNLYRYPNEYTVGPFWLHHPDHVEAEIVAAVKRIIGATS